MPAPTLTAKSVLAAVAATAAVALLPASASATARYANSQGSANNTCTVPSSPCSLRRAVEQIAAPNDTVLIDPGTYNESTPLHVHADGVTLQAASKTRPLIAFADSIKNDYALYSTFPNVYLRHLAVRAGGDNVTGVLGMGLTLDDSSVSTLGSQSTAAASSTSAAISNSTLLAGPFGTGASVQGAADDVRHTTIWTGGSALFVHTTSSDNHVAVTRVHDSILHGDTQDVYAVSGHDINHTAAANIDHTAYRPDKSYTGDQYGYINDKGANTAAEPKLADPTAGDVHELSGSPTIDAGAAEAGDGLIDMDGEDRSQGAAPDMGADEFTVAAPLPQSNSAGAAQTASTPAVAPAATHRPTDVAPALTSLKLSRRSLRPGKSATITYRDSKAATTTLIASRRVTVRRHGRRQVRWVTARKITHADHAGTNSVPFKVSRRSLPAGSYRLVAMARDAAGHVSGAKTATFRITR